MPKYNLTTIERWEQKVDYCDIEADTLEEAYQQIVDRDVSYSNHEIIEDGDEVLCLWSAEDENGVEMPIPPELEKEPPSYHALMTIIQGFMSWIPDVNEGEAGYEVQQLAKAAIAQYATTT